MLYSARQCKRIGAWNRSHITTTDSMIDETEMIKSSTTGLCCFAEMVL